MGMLTLFKCTTGEDWHILMSDLSNLDDDCIEGVNCGSPFAKTFLIIFTIITFVMLNLFILILIK